MELSVVIPVYNVEHSLAKCVASVVAQGVGSSEIILVDDGSPDGSGALCDRLAAEHPSVKVIHKDNGGLSDARNAGIAVATGQYITFVDSDDYLSPGVFTHLLDIIHANSDADIVEYSFVKTNPSGHQTHIVLPETSYSDMSSYWLDGMAYRHAYAWNKVYRRSLFAEVRFPKGTAFEDLHTLPLLLRRCHKVVTTSVGYYHYVYNPEGITSRAGLKELSDLLQAHIAYLSMNSEEFNYKDKRFGDYYTSALNVQIDVAELSDLPPSLPLLKLKPTNWKLLILNTLGFKTLCKISHLAKLLRPKCR